MKWFSYILSLYILLLAGMPCSDTMACDTSSSVETGYHADHDAGHSHGEDDTCSPFCACLCCGQTASLTLQALELTLYTRHYSCAFPNYEASFSPEVYLAIWQPPKLS